MNQTVTVNIGSIVFHIEVDAYENLKKYLNKIKSYFNNSAEQEEIMADIEARIAEIFSEKITTTNQVIKQTDVDEVISILGKPEQFIDEDEPEENESNKNNGETKITKKLYRNPDDKLLGGVAAGIASYFGFDAIWMRIVFVMSTIFIGVGPLIYIILWIVIPEARTAAEKLQMKGEPINIDTLGKTIEEEAKKVNNKFKSIDSKQFNNKVEHFFNSLFNFIFSIINGILNVLGKVLGVAFIIMGTIAAIIFIAALLGTDIVYAITPNGVFSVETTQFFTAFFSSEEQYNLAIISVVLLLLAPIVGLLYAGIKLLFKIKGNVGIPIGLVVFFIIGSILAFLIGTQIATEFKTYSSLNTIHAINTEAKTIKLVSSNINIPGKPMLNVDDEDFILTMDSDSIYMGYPTVNVKPSNNDSILIKITKSSNGSTKKSSLKNAQLIQYKHAVNDSIIDFSKHYTFSIDNKIRDQQIDITLYLPIGKAVFFDKSLSKLIYDVDNVTNTLDQHMINKTWIMMPNGLTCLNCNSIQGVTNQQVNKLLNNINDTTIYD